MVKSYKLKFDDEIIQITIRWWNHENLLFLPQVWVPFQAFSPDSLQQGWQSWHQPIDIDTYIYMYIDTYIDRCNNFFNQTVTNLKYLHRQVLRFDEGSSVCYKTLPEVWDDWVSMDGDEFHNHRQGLQPSWSSSSSCGQVPRMENLINRWVTWITNHESSTKFNTRYWQGVDERNTRQIMIVDVAWVEREQLPLEFTIRNRSERT